MLHRINWSLSAEGPILRVGQGHLVACAEARPTLAFLAATPFVASTGFFDLSGPVFLSGKPGFFFA